MEDVYYNDNTGSIDDYIEAAGLNAQDYDDDIIHPQNIIIVKGIEIMTYDYDQIVAVLKLSDKSELEALIEIVKAKASKFTLARALKASIFEMEYGTLIAPVGVYILARIGSESKKYQTLKDLIPRLKDEAFEDLIRYFGQTRSDKKSGHNIPEEFRAKSIEDLEGYNAKKTSVELRTPNLETVENKEHWLYDKNILVTGNFLRWPNRSDIVKVVTNHGGHVKTSISKNLHFVIAGYGAGPSKLKQIQDIPSITLLDEDGFIDLMGG